MPGEYITMGEKITEQVREIARLRADVKRLRKIEKAATALRDQLRIGYEDKCGAELRLMNLEKALEK